MKRVYILCEGQTEETFVNKLLYPYFINMSILLTPIVLKTKTTAAQSFKGGVSTYGKIKRNIVLLAKNDSKAYVTTMLDYYRLPDDTPGINNHDTDAYCMIETLEREIDLDIDLPNCFVNLSLHEFEGLLFANPTCFSSVTSIENVAKIQNIRNAFPTPEHINNSWATAPSKRLEEIIPNYAKVQNGSAVAAAIGIDCLMQECKHFSSWVDKIKSF